jgi:hypothetical protein
MVLIWAFRQEIFLKNVNHRVDRFESAHEFGFSEQAIFRSGGLCASPT